MTLRPHSVVHSVIYDEKKNQATGVRIIDANTKEMIEYYAKIIFLNASPLNTNLILLNSTSNRFPNGLGNDNGLLGKFMAFHSYRGRISAEYEGFMDSKSDGRRPTGTYIPRFRNVLKQETDFLRGYATSFNAGRMDGIKRNGLGEILKDNLLNTSLGLWGINASMMAETIPKESKCS